MAARRERVAELLQRRMTGESVARIIGEREFYGLPFTLNAATLEPRPETELLVDMALGALPAGGRLLDLGTGTGCIPIAILANQPDATGGGGGSERLGAGGCARQCRAEWGGGAGRVSCWFLVRCLGSLSPEGRGVGFDVREVMSEMPSDV